VPSRICGTCGSPIAETESAREFDGTWYHNTTCIKAAIDLVHDELAERGLETGDLVYILSPGADVGHVILEPAVLVECVKYEKGWWERWKVRFLADLDGMNYERNVSPAYIIRRASEPLSVPIDSDAIC
jgi:hypothetical protein